MLKRYLPFLLLFVVVVACRKDKLETKPSITVKDISATDVLPTQDILITLEYDDKEGDIGGGSVTYLRNRLNVVYPVINDLADSIGYLLPDFPKRSNGEIEVRIPAGFLDENPFQNDTLEFGLFVIDAAGNRSDTVTTPVIIERQF